MSDGFFEDVRTYVGFGPGDTRRLAAFGDRIQTELPAISDVFYDRMTGHPGALGVFEDQAQVDRLKRTLIDWLESGLSGPHDERFFERRLRIGRVHVRIQLPQQYMLTAMNVVRAELHDRVEKAYADDAQVRRQTRASVDRWLDLELAIMLHSFREDSEARLGRKERLAGIGQVAGTIGHELRNPLGVIESSLYLLRRKVESKPDVTRHLDKIGHQVQNANGIITDLLELVRDRPPARQPVKISTLVRDSAAEIRWPEGFEVRPSIEPEDLGLLADEGLLRRALVNLMTNSIQAMQGTPGAIEVRAHAAGDDVVVEVLDTGPGFDDELLTNALEPLVTTRTRGVGLGLALVARVADRHGGHTELDNRPEGGARVRMVFPGNE